MAAAEVEIAVVGGGPAGLAVAVAVAQRGGHAAVFERERIAASWGRHYDRLHLHTIRSLSGIPGHAMPWRYGRYVARADFVRHLEAVGSERSLDVRCGEAVERIERVAGGYRLALGEAAVTARAVVVATGCDHTPLLPDWALGGSFRGVLVHASAYRDPAPFRDRDVLVVGAGNSGTEIATDLVEGGARSVRVAVRTPPHVVPRQVLGVPAQAIGIAFERSPTAFADALAALIARAAVGDLRRFGLPAPTDGVVSRHRARGAVPVLDVGFAGCLKAGAIEIVAAVESLAEDGAVLAGGARVRVDAIVAATGYETGLAPLVGALGVLDERGVPRVAGAVSAPGMPGLHFVGYRNPLGGRLREIGREARAVAATLADRAARRGVTVRRR